MKTKIIPFDIELAKKIKAGKVEGRIVTRDNRSVYLVDTYTNACYLTITNLQEKVEIKYGHSSMLQYLQGSNNLFIELPEETSKLSDITTNEGFHQVFSKHEFKPFDKVLVRNGENCWQCALFSHMSDRDDFPYFANDFSFQQCIPYEGNENLVGTTNKPNEE